MSSSTHTNEVHFRFKRLDKMQAFTLEREILGSVKAYDEGKTCYCVCVPLTRMNLDDINDYYVRQRVVINDCDILISTSTESGTHTVEVPVIVNHMLKYIDCQLTFSVTIK